MPQDIVNRILTHLPSREIGTSALVCRELNQALKDDDIWRILFNHRFPSVNPRSIQNFQSAYKDLYSNLSKGVYALHTIKGHEDAVLSLAIFDGKLFSGSHDDTIKVWDLKTGSFTATLRGHNGEVYPLCVLGGKLFSGSSDCTIKVWDIKTEKCTVTLKGHGNVVNSIAIFEGKLFSASRDKSIKVWDLKTGECTATLTGHSDSIISLAVFDGKLFSGSADRTINIRYARTSTIEQIAGLEAQLKELRSVGCDKIYQEQISSVAERCQLKAAMDFVREGDILVVAKLDRLARSVADLVTIVQSLEKKNVSLRILNLVIDTNTPTGKLMLTMLGAIGQFEREIMLERQREGIAKAKAAGKFKGRKPLDREIIKEVLRLCKTRITRKEVASRLEIGEATVYRVLKETKTVL